MRRNRSYSLLYDGDCRVCTAFARAVSFLDLRRHLRVRPIQESEALLAAIPPTERLSEAHAVSPDGRVSSGAEAMPTVIAALVGNPAIEPRLRGSPRSMALLGRSYEVLREIRGRLTCGIAAPASVGRSPR